MTMTFDPGLADDDDLSRFDEELGIVPTLPSPAAPERPYEPARPRKPRRSTAIAVAVGGLALVAAGFALGRWTAPDDVADAPTVEQSSDPDSDRLLEVALELHRTGDLNAATQAYEAVLARRPDDQFALYNLGLISQTGGDLSAAIDYYSRAIDVDPNMTTALYNRGLAHRDSGSADAAIDDLEGVLALEPQNAVAMYNLGNLLIAEGRVEDGTELVARAAELDPTLRGD